MSTLLSNFIAATMLFHLSLLLVLHIYTVILMFSNFLGRMFTSIAALLVLVFPSLIIARGQLSSTSVSVKRGPIQPMELDWILAICVSLLGQKPATSQDARFKPFPILPAWLFSPLSNVSPLWYHLTILKATWLLATVGYVSAREVGKASAGIISHVSRQLIKHIWFLGLNQIQILRLNVLNRLELARFAAHDRVTSYPSTWTDCVVRSLPYPLSQALDIGANIYTPRPGLAGRSL